MACEGNGRLRLTMVFLASFCIALTCVLTTFGGVTNAQVLDIHVIAHTHDDVGWLKTVDEYYYGANQSIQNAGVQYILDTVYRELLVNPARKFIYVEIAFFQRWWDEQTDEVKAGMQALVANGQFEFINGGWCMNDEAGAHNEDTAIQMTTGLQFLYENFGVVPTIGWQIDPFGHANAHATLLGLIGFNAVFFARIDYQDYAVRSASKSLEFIWRPSKTFGSNSDIFAHALYQETYCYPNDFAFEWGDDPIQTDLRLFNPNFVAKGEEFAQQMQQRTQNYATNQILVTFGCDFQYQDAVINFKNMDKLMAYINSNSSLGLNVFYSTPSQYIAAIHATGQSFPLKEDDIFPYASSIHAYWTGYFTSRSALKGYVRTCSNFNQATNKILTLAMLPGNNTDLVEEVLSFTQSLSIAQHHDAVAGTEQQHVADDYAERLSIGTVAAQGVFSYVLANLVTNGTSSPQFYFCEYLNISMCPALDSLSSGDIIPVALYNPIGWDRVEYVRLPTNTSDVQVTSDGNAVEFQILPSADPSAAYTIVFAAKVPALGYAIYNIEPATNSSPVTPLTTGTSIENDYFQVNVNASGYLSDVFIKSNNQTFSLAQNWFWYNASNGNYGQASGAYVFRPNSSTPYEVGAPTYEIYAGDFVQEIRQYFAGWLNQTVRLYGGQNWIEVEATVGPIPIGDDLGKEIITRYQTSLNTNNTWYTDSQGLEYQERILNYRFSWPLEVNEPVSGNYYPVNTAIHMVDTAADLYFGTTVDRSRGGSSLVNGQLETMVHRRLLVDDGFGVGEPLNESTIIRTTSNVIVGSISGGSLALERQRALLSNHPFIVAFGEPNLQGIVNTMFAPLTASLPLNVHLQSLELQEDGQVVLRLHHLFAVNEDPVLSQPVTVDLSTLFSYLTPVPPLIETALTVTELQSDLDRLQWNSTAPLYESQSPEITPLPRIPNDGFTVTLNPMEIRTFLLRFQELMA